MRLRFLPLFFFIILISSPSWSQNFSLQWATSIPGLNSWGIRSIKTDKQGNVFIMGVFSDSILFDQNNSVSKLKSTGDKDIFLAKYDANGHYLWSKSFGGPYSDIANTFALDKKGNIYLTGFYMDTVDFDPSPSVKKIAASSRYYELFLAKYDVNGNYIFAENIAQTGIDFLLSNPENAIALDNNGNAYLFGTFRNETDFDPSEQEARITPNEPGTFLAKYDSLGRYIWVKKITDFGDINAFRLAIDPKGNICAMGNFLGTNDFDPSASLHTLTSEGIGPDIFLAKYDTDGNYLWATSMRGGNLDRAHCIEIGNDGDISISGHFTGTIDFDPSEQVKELTSENSFSVFLAKYDEKGNYKWAKSLISNDVAYCYGLTVAVNGSITIAGYFRGILNINPPHQGATLSSNADFMGLHDYDIYLARYDALGNYVQAQNFGDVGIDFGFAITLDKQENLLLIGEHTGNLDLAPNNSSNTPLSSTTYFSGFIGKFGSALVTDISASEVADKDVLISPNPSSGIFHVQENVIRVIVRNLAGELVMENSSSALDISNLPKGLYLTEIHTANRTVHKKIILE